MTASAGQSFALSSGRLAAVTDGDMKGDVNASSTSPRLETDNTRGFNATPRPSSMVTESMISQTMVDNDARPIDSASTPPDIPSGQMVRRRPIITFPVGVNTLPGISNERKISTENEQTTLEDMEASEGSSSTARQPVSDVDEEEVSSSHHFDMPTRDIDQTSTTSLLYEGEFATNEVINNNHVVIIRNPQYIPPTTQGPLKLPRSSRSNSETSIGTTSELRENEDQAHEAHHQERSEIGGRPLTSVNLYIGSENHEARTARPTSIISNASNNNNARASLRPVETATRSNDSEEDDFSRLNMVLRVRPTEDIIDRQDNPSLLYPLANSRSGEPRPNRVDSSYSYDVSENLSVTREELVDVLTRITTYNAMPNDPSSTQRQGATLIDGNESARAADDILLVLQSLLGEALRSQASNGRVQTEDVGWPTRLASRVYPIRNLSEPTVPTFDSIYERCMRLERHGQISEVTTCLEYAVPLLLQDEEVYDSCVVASMEYARYSNQPSNRESIMRCLLDSTNIQGIRRRSFDGSGTITSSLQPMLVIAESNNNGGNGIIRKPTTTIDGLSSSSSTRSSSAVAANISSKTKSSRQSTSGDESTVHEVKTKRIAQNTVSRSGDMRQSLSLSNGANGANAGFDQGSGYLSWNGETQHDYPTQDLEARDVLENRVSLTPFYDALDYSVRELYCYDRNLGMGMCF